jgi:predicted amidohydrolase YtcJ
VGGTPLSPSVLLRDGRIWTGDPPDPRSTWLRLEAGRIVSHGGPGTEEPSADEIVDLGGAHVLPAFTDAHTHLSAGAWFPAYEDGTSLGSREDAIAAVRDAVNVGPEGSWLVVTGLDPHGWKDPRLPTREELDAVCPQRPALLMVVTLHSGTANSAALRASGVAWMPDAHDDVERGRWGQPTGPLWEAAFSRARWAADRALLRAIGDAGTAGLLDAAAERHLSLGIVRAHEPGVAPDTAAELEALATRTPLRLSWSISPHAGQQEPPRTVSELPPGPYGYGPRQLKVFLDGAHRCAVAVPARRVLAAGGRALRTAVEERRTGPLRGLAERRVRLVGTEVRTPYLRLRDRALADLIDECAAQEVGLRMHALGNLAVLQAARVARVAGLEPGTWHAEHVLGLRDEDVEDVARAGPVCSVQPGFMPGYADVIRGSGMLPAIRVIPLRSLLDAGVETAISSDHPCGPLDPLHNIRLAVTRRLPDGSALDEREAIGRAEALTAATRTAARAAGGDAPGVLVPGAPADLVVVDGDPFVEGSEVRETWIDGAAVWTGS